MRCRSDPRLVQPDVLETSQRSFNMSVAKNKKEYTFTDMLLKSSGGQGGKNLSPASQDRPLEGEDFKSPVTHSFLEALFAR
ncbi:hypothetical protein NDU88_004661 [Pleurodeles waltl]|uniref:Uncharacterized protein n=1 Tax=Pleurodeles waltl TaxID=8319 RepID=A0AAV7VGW7_PLEWA|nr:hypothetical protein NDU88_004661 [Pleurodeles waltl]